MNYLKWLQAYITVWGGMASSLDRTRQGYIAAFVFVAFLASIVGPLGTLVLVVLVLFGLPALNTDVRRAVNEEYKKQNKS